MQKRTAFLSLFRDSAAELKKLTSLVTAALLLALQVVLAGYSIDVLPFLRISFSYLASAVTGMLFGPTVAMLSAAAGDILGYCVHPSGVYFPPYMLTAMFSGCLYGIFLYHSPIRLSRVIASKSLVTVFSNLLMNTLWNSMVYGKSFFAILPIRIVKNLVLLPVEIALLFVVCKAAQKVYNTAFLRCGISPRKG